MNHLEEMKIEESSIQNAIKIKVSLSLLLLKLTLFYYKI